MTEDIKRSHNVSLILYHEVCPARYRRKVFTQEVQDTLKDVCEGIEKRYEIRFIEIGADEDHVHFLIQSVPTYSPKELVQIIKSITGREILSRHPEVKIMLWGGKFWTSGYYINTVGRYANEKIIKNYVQNQGNKYNRYYHNEHALFD